MRAIWLLAPVLAAACSSSAASQGGTAGSGGTDAGGGGGPPCQFDSDCADGSSCATGPVHEVKLESSDDPHCIPQDQVIGAGPATWPWQPGGRALALRLCTAQGLSPGSSAAADAKRAQDRILLQATGIHGIRLDLSWSRIEPDKGSFDFSAYDPMIDAADSMGLEVFGILAYGVPWASSLTTQDNKYPPDNPSDYADFARAVAQHYAGRIHRYELWNEPNGGYRFFRPDLNGDADAYARLMVAGADAIHQSCADCTVYSAGLFFHEQVVNGAIEFTHDMLIAEPDAFGAVDAFAFHPYPLYPPSAAPEANTGGERALGGMVADLRAVLDLHGAPALPFAVTEFGWPSFGKVTEQTQADFLAREVLLGASLGLDPLCWFNVTDGPNHGTTPPEDDFGLYHYGSEVPGATPSPKPSRDALSWLAKIGAGAVFAGPDADSSLHDPSAGRFALDFDTAGGRWTALWQTGAPRAVHLIGETRSAYDVTGKLLASPGGGALDITATGSPVYLYSP